jgi:hypothetical protein
MCFARSVFLILVWPTPAILANQYWEWVAASTVAHGSNENWAEAGHGAILLTKARPFPIVAGMSGLFAICGIRREIIS